jgi:hypothetical protein
VRAYFYHFTWHIEFSHGHARGRQRVDCSADIYNNTSHVGLLYIMSENTSTPQTQLSPNLTLDESFYGLTEEERTFFKQQTGIPDDDELKAHILRVQAEAYEVCIR